MGKKDFKPIVDERFYVDEMARLVRKHLAMECAYDNKALFEEHNAKVDLTIMNYPTWKGDMNLVFRYPLPKWKRPPISKHEEIVPIFDSWEDDEIHPEVVKGEHVLLRERKNKQRLKFCFFNEQ